MLLLILLSLLSPSFPFPFLVGQWKLNGTISSNQTQTGRVRVELGESGIQGLISLNGGIESSGLLTGSRKSNETVLLGIQVEEEMESLKVVVRSLEEFEKIGGEDNNEILLEKKLNIREVEGEKVAIGDGLQVFFAGRNKIVIVFNQGDDSFVFVLTRDEMVEEEKALSFLDRYGANVALAAIFLASYLLSFYQSSEAKRIEIARQAAQEIEERSAKKIK